LNKLFAQCTIAVTPIATSAGTNMAMTGINNVPSPKPEKRIVPCILKHDGKLPSSKKE
jgi:hypothetical protein